MEFNCYCYSNSECLTPVECSIIKQQLPVPPKEKFNEPRQKVIVNAPSSSPGGIKVINNDKLDHSVDGEITSSHYQFRDYSTQTIVDSPETVLTSLHVSNCKSSHFPSVQEQHERLWRLL